MRGSISDKLNEILTTIASLKTSYSSLSWEELTALIDLTRLEKQTQVEDIQRLVEEAKQHRVAAICVFPDDLNLIESKISIKRATVINFPSGDEPQQDVLKALNKVVLEKKADEIDYVFPYSTYLAGKEALALAYCKEVFQHCKQNNLLLKVIIETGALSSIDMIYKLSRAIIKNGCDFLKTSTGKTTIGATIPAAYAILAAIVDSQTTCGIKISGGIKTIEQALEYTNLAEHMLRLPLSANHFRLGVSRFPYRS